MVLPPETRARNNGLPPDYRNQNNHSCYTHNPFSNKLV